MKYLLLILFFLQGHAAIFCQQQYYKSILIPVEKTNSTGEIAAFINNQLSDKKEKLTAIYNWVGKNLEYDTDSMYVINWNSNKENRITEALRRRKGVCVNFAAIFSDIANKCGIPSYTVDGYTRQWGSIDKYGHSWAVVNLNNEWLFCDPTWDKDATGNPHYFLIPPEQFIQTHMPFDPLWQILEKPVSTAAFNNGKLNFKKNKPNPLFDDSLQVFKSMGELQQLESSYKRLLNVEKNELIRTNIAYINMEIHIFYEEKVESLYNNAVVDFNRANDILNDFIQYKNNQFLPVRNLSHLKNQSATAHLAIAAARLKIKEIESFSKVYQYNPVILTDRLTHLEKRLEELAIYIKQKDKNK